MGRIISVVKCIGSYIRDYVVRVPGVLFCLACLAATVFLLSIPQGQDVLIVELESGGSRLSFLGGAIFFTFALYLSLSFSSDYVNHKMGIQNPGHWHHLVAIVVASSWLAIVAALAIVAFIARGAIQGNDNEFVPYVTGGVVFAVAAGFLYFVVDRFAHKRWFERKVAQLAKRIRRYLQAGLMADGVATVRSEGTPQGGQWGVRGWICLCALLWGALFLLVVFAVVKFGRNFPIGAAAAVFLSLGLILLIGAYLGVLFDMIRFPILGGAIIFIVVYAWLSVPEAFYSVGRRAGSSEYNEHLPDRCSLSDEYADWSERLGHPQRPVMLLVAAQGGASRAGAWTGAVLAELDRRTVGQARKHIFAINAVSGGAVGAAGYVAHVRLGTPHNALHEPLKTFTGSDALSPTIIAMMFPNLLAQLFPARFLPDRAAALEMAWEEAWNVSRPSDKNLLEQGFVSFNTSTPSQWVPILIVQGASLETGRRILTSRVNFEASGASDVNADDFYTLAKREVRVSTAIHNGARFPFLSPAGVIEITKEQKVNIVDGGYFDPTGVETIRELGRALKKIDDNLDIIYLIIRYDEEEQKAGSPRLNLNEILGPARALMASRGGHAEHMSREIEKENGGDRVFKVILKDCVKENEYGERETKIAVPMNWVLSKKVQDYIQDSAKGPSSVSSECRMTGDTPETLSRLAVAMGYKPR